MLYDATPRLLVCRRGQPGWTMLLYAIFQATNRKANVCLLYTSDAADERIVKVALRQNGYPNAFIEHNFHTQSRTQATEQNPRVVLRVQFKGDAGSELFR